MEQNMATASTTDDQISCSFCLEIFTDPRVLPCGHTFCLTCLQNHIDANNTDDAFMCPNCRDVVGISDNKQPTSSWASQFKRNLALVDAIGLIKQFKICELKIELVDLMKMQTFSSLPRLVFVVVQQG
ncbi:E3 ubiquitin-protein ligase Midline-1-like [Gigantopelta aegis]|uniref:E3 ubiquitin-protein ligase Midline-1-like n=1 Tax=Gigantopelta aegis TaxID=1735272 RepID=UPI001B888C63|nr:E3 ubiquitin-protein ligase Midline-1-like [Gigantopelta aegis]